MNTSKPPTEPYRQVVGLLAEALGIRQSDKASRKGLRDFMTSSATEFYVAEVTETYLKKHDTSRDFPCVKKVLRAALVYYSPTLVLHGDSINPRTLEWWKKQAKKATMEGQEWAGEFHIALFAAKLIHHVESDYDLGSEEMAWFPVKLHHKISFAVAVMYFLYLKPQMRRRMQATLYEASTGALCYLASFHRCVRCGQDYEGSKDPVCRVCPALEEGEILEFERLRECNSRLESEVDHFFDGFGGEPFQERVRDAVPLESEDTAWPM